MPTAERYIPMSHEKGKNRLITVTGVSGCGKDYLVSMAQQMSPDIVGSKVAVFNFGSELLATLSAQSPDISAPSRDILKYLPQESIDPAIQITLQRLLASQPALYLSHIVHRQRDKLVISPENDRLVNSLEYIFVHSDPALIHAWRQQEQGHRQRELQAIDDIALHQNVAQMATYALAMSLGSGFVLLHNRPSDTAEAASVLLEESSKLY